MIINAQTKISNILKERAEALEAIVSLSPKFEKLRNSLLRKIIAPRTTIAAASKIGGCETGDFFKKLAPLGFETGNKTLPTENEVTKTPAFMLKLDTAAVKVLDVRPILSAGKDPLSEIIKLTSTMQTGQVLKLINSFYPEPLVVLLKKQGFETHVQTISDDLVEAYFHKIEKTTSIPAAAKPPNQAAWNELLEKYKGRLKELDVSQLAMPLPMITILDALDELPGDHALFVYHKRIPVYLLPELAARKLSFLAKEISEANVNLIIFKD
jgi:uncharacterized protein (DUF2249 family)